MRVLATGDTHVPDWYHALPEELIREARRSDLVLLAGDIVGREVMEAFSGIAPVEAVHGNFCHPDLKKSLPSKKVLELNGWRVGLTHGHLGEGTSTDERALSLFTKGEVDLVVHGHTHHHSMTNVGGIPVIDPGSPLDVRFTQTNSYAIISLGEKVETRFVTLESAKGRRAV